MKVNDLKGYQVDRWMHDKLQLSGVKELIFAVIYKCTKKDGEYTGSAPELAQFIGYQPITIYMALKALTESRHLIKREYIDPERGIKMCAYRVNPEILKGV